MKINWKIFPTKLSSRFQCWWLGAIETNPFLSTLERHHNHFESVFHLIQLVDDVLHPLIGLGMCYWSRLNLCSFHSFSDVVHSVSTNMLPCRTQTAVVSVAQVKSTVSAPRWSLLSFVLIASVENGGHNACSRKVIVWLNHGSIQLSLWWSYVNMFVLLVVSDDLFSQIIVPLLFFSSKTFLFHSERWSLIFSSGRFLSFVVQSSSLCLSLFLFSLSSQA